MEAQIIGDRVNAPYLNTLADGGVTFSSMYAVTHPSQPNYLHLFSGGNQGVVDDNLPLTFSTTATSTYPWKVANLGAEIIAAGFTFAGYCEQLETAGAADWADYDPHAATQPTVYYRRKHNPWANWVAKVSPVPANQLAGTVNRAFTQFPSNFTLLPTVSFVVPNQLHDMHDGSRKEGDTWLQTNLSAYASWTKAHNSLLLVTWDEDDYSATNRIPTIFYGASLKDGTADSSTWTLHNLLRTLEDMYGSTTHAGAAAQLRAISGPFAGEVTPTVARYREGLGGYTGVVDTMVSQDAPTISYAATHDLVSDLDINTTAAGNQVGQVLVKFPNLFGTGSGQVPPGATVLSAKLILSTPASGDSVDTFRLHRMLVDWTNAATWNSLGAGVDLNDVEAVSAATFSLAPVVDNAPAIFDVTSDIDAWQAGAVNRGWVIRPSTSGGSDGWTLKSSETTSDVTLRPTLEVVYTTASGYAAWKAQKFAANAPATQTAELADPDQDGHANLIEYALGSEPLTAGSRKHPVLSRSGGANVLTFNLATSASGVTVTVQVSSDLSAWSDGSTYGATTVASNANTTQVSRNANATGGDTIVVRDNTLSTTVRHRYMRLKVSVP